MEKCGSGGQAQPGESTPCGLLGEAPDQALHLSTSELPRTGDEKDAPTRQMWVWDERRMGRCAGVA